MEVSSPDPQSWPTQHEKAEPVSPTSTMAFDNEHRNLFHSKLSTNNGAFSEHRLNTSEGRRANSLGRLSLFDSEIGA